jgi:hypothetical protein
MQALLTEELSKYDHLDESHQYAKALANSFIYTIPPTAIGFLLSLYIKAMPLRKTVESLDETNMQGKTGNGYVEQKTEADYESRASMSTNMQEEEQSESEIQMKDLEALQKVIQQ